MSIECIAALAATRTRVVQDVFFVAWRMVRLLFIFVVHFLLATSLRSSVRLFDGPKIDFLFRIVHTLASLFLSLSRHSAWVIDAALHKLLMDLIRDKYLFVVRGNTLSGAATVCVCEPAWQVLRATSQTFEFRYAYYSSVYATRLQITTQAYDAMCIPLDTRQWQSVWLNETRFDSKKREKKTDDSFSCVIRVFIHGISCSFINVVA